MPEQAVQQALMNFGETINQINRDALAKAVLPLYEAVDFLLDRGVFEDKADVRRAEQLRDQIRAIRASLLR